MKAFLPLAITDAMLTSSGLYETAPTAYAGGSTYALNDVASEAGAAGLIGVYKSLSAGNIGHTPSTSPTYWLHLCDTYQVYSGGATYAAGDRVIDATAHWVYESAVAGNIGQALDDPAKWLSVGPTNKWAAFTYLKTNKATAPNQITFVVTPDSRVDSMAFTGCVANTITVTATSATWGGAVYSKTINMRRRDIRGMWSYLFGKWRYRRNYAVFDIPPYRDIVLTVTLTGAGDVTLGKWGIGRQVYLGRTLAGAKSGLASTSTISRDDFNELELTPKPTAPEATLALYAERKYVPAIDDFRAECEARPVFWSGTELAYFEYYDPLAMLGPSFNFDIQDMDATKATVTLEIQGM
jgi:hypothetical protein